MIQSEREFFRELIVGLLRKKTGKIEINKNGKITNGKVEMDHSLCELFDCSYQIIDCILGMNFYPDTLCHATTEFLLWF